MPSPEFRNLLSMFRARPELDNPTPEQWRELLEKTARLFTPPPGVAFETVVAGGVRAEWAIPEDTGRDRAVLYFHGGGYALGSIETHRHLAALIALAASTPVLLIDYRRAPEHPFPTALDDALSAYRWLCDCGLSPGRIAVGGDSAGGGLAVAAMIALRDRSEPLPATAVCLSPWTDLDGAGPSLKLKAAVDPVVQESHVRRLASWYLNGTDPRHPLASPLYADLAGLPPLLVHVGTAEVLLDDATRLAEVARRAGGQVTLEVVDDMIHVWHYYAPIIPEGQAAIDSIGAYLRDVLVTEVLFAGI